MMLWTILKKDLLKRKVVNAILFLFITLATVFLSSSVNNILVVSTAVDYYIDYANLPDYNVVTTSIKEESKIVTWLDQQKKDGVINTFDYNRLLIVPDKAMQFQKDEGIQNLDLKGASIYMSKMDVDYSKVFDKNGNEITLQQGEVAMSISMVERNGLSLGDRIIIKSKDKESVFVLKEIVKDAAFGNEMVGMIRLIVNEQDYDRIQDDFQKINLFYVTGDDATFSKNLNQQGFDSIANIVGRDTYKMVYSFDMIMAALLILIGICLILIALLVLRFTLVFTMEEQYQEIGILKVIGLRNYAIKKLYLIKYLAIVLAGSLLGLGISMPVSNMMVESISKNLIMESAQMNFGINIICAFVIVFLVLAFCYLCARKLNKVSAITSIRSGSTGERFHRFKGLRLTKRYFMPVSIYLGLHDILTHLRRYAVLMVTFCISFLLITIPLNTLNTMRSNEMVSKFMLNPDSAVYVRNLEQPGEDKYTSLTQLKKAMDRLTQELQEKGYDASLTAAPLFFMKYNSPGEDVYQNILTTQVYGEDNDYLDYDRGVEPQLENEIAISKLLLDENQWSIGDYIHVTMQGKEKKMLITGSYSDYMQLGRSVRLNPIIDCSQEILTDYWSIMVNMKHDRSQIEMAEALTKKLPSYEWTDAQSLVDQNVGGIQDALSQQLLPMTGLLCAVIMLITLLMGKLFIARERNEIAMMKSIGFTYRAIQKWQLLRVLLVAFISMMIAVPLSLLSNQFVLKPIFAIMGADVAIQVNLLQAYVLYPGILFIGISVASILAVRGIRKVDIKDLNNLE